MPESYLFRCLECDDLVFAIEDTRDCWCLSSKGRIEDDKLILEGSAWPILILFDRAAFETARQNCTRGGNTRLCLDVLPCDAEDVRFDDIDDDDEGDEDD